MRMDRQKEIERVGIAAVAAIIIHLAVFLVVEYGKFLTIDDFAGYIGPLTVGFEELVPTPHLTDSDEPQPEQPPAETRDEPEEPSESEQPPVAEAEDVEPAEIVDEPPQQPPQEPPVESVESDAAADTTLGEPEPQEPDQQTAEVTEQEQSSDMVPPTPREAVSQPAKPAAQEAVEKVAKPVPEQMPQTVEPAKSTPHVVEPDHIFLGKDDMNEFSVEMVNKSHRAKPAIRIRPELPRWVEDEQKKLVVVFSFILDANGRITYLNLDKSSGYQDVDTAIAQALMPRDGNGWQFSRPAGDERVMGKLTYRIHP